MKYQKMTKKEILNIIECNNLCLISTCEDNEPYIIPVHYESDYRDNTLIITIKSKSIGKKIRYMNNNDRVCLYFDFQNNYCIKTIIAYGTVFIDDDSECDDKVEINIVIDKVTGRKYDCISKKSNSRLYTYK